MNTTTLPIEQLLVDVATASILPLSLHFNPDCCIAATRVAVTVFERLGFEAYAQPTRLRVWNRKLWERIASEQNTFAHGVFLDGEWSVGVGFGEDPRKQHDPDWKGFDGHLVAIVDDRFLVDLSFGQTSRPQKGMPTKPVMIMQMHGEWPVTAALENFTLCYEPIPNAAFLQSPDWTDEERTAHIVRRIINIVTP